MSLVTNFILVEAAQRRKGNVGPMVPVGRLGALSVSYDAKQVADNVESAVQDSLYWHLNVNI